MSSKSRLDLSLNAFGGELLSFVQRASDSIHALKRTVEQRPSAGVQDFKECLEDLEQQVSDFTDEIQQLVACTSDTTSLEELIGHCTAVYHANRTAALSLEQHLTQYGYQRLAGAVLEPENPDDFMLQEEQFGMQADGSEALEAPRTALCRLPCRTEAHHLTALGSMQQQRQVHSTPTSPVSKSSLGAVRSAHVPSRLGSSQPGSPTAGYRPPAAGGPWGPAAAAAAQAAAAPGLGCGGVGPAHAGLLLTQLKPHERSSFGTTSSTPPGLLMSPGVAALANKYATSSVGGSSVGCLSLGGSQPSTGHPTKRTDSRDLSLAYSMLDDHSPNLPIFGSTPANHSQQQQQQQEWRAADCDAGAAAADQAMPGAAAGSEQHGAAAAAGDSADGKGGSGAATAAGGGDDEDTTGQLYSSLIHSNMDGVSSRDVDMQEDQAAEPVTPRAGGASCPGSPRAPGTVGRLPAEWHSQKMQELDSLQADLTTTLSQMKRTPSRSRLASLAGPARASESEDECEQQQQERWQRQEEQPQLETAQQRAVQTIGHNAPGAGSRAVDDEQGADADGLQQGSGAASVAVAAANMQTPPSAGGSNLQRLRQRLLQQQQLHLQQQQHEAAPPPPAAAGDANQLSSSSAANANAAAAAAAAVSAAAAAAAAATADLESLMESLSRKYAADAEAAASPAAAPGDAGAAVSPEAGTEAARRLCPQQQARATSPAAAGAGAGSSGQDRKETEDADAADFAAAGPGGLSAKYAALSLRAEPAVQQQQQQTDAPLLPPPAPSSSPKQQQGWAGGSVAARSSAAAAAAARSSAVMMCSVASDASGLSTPGRPRLAAAIAAWHNAVRMDCPSPLSPDSPAKPESLLLRGSNDSIRIKRSGSPCMHVAADEALEETPPPPAAAAAESSVGAVCSPDAARQAAGVSGGLEEAAAAPAQLQQKQQASVLTPATQRAIRYAVAAVGVDSVRPKSSIRQPQPTTDLKRLEEVRGYWHSLQQHGPPVQQQQQQEQRVVQNLEQRLTGVAEAQQGSIDAAAAGGSTARTAAATAAASAAEGLKQPGEKVYAARKAGGSPASSTAAAGNEQRQACKQLSTCTGSSSSSSNHSSGGSSSTRKGKQSVASPDTQLSHSQQQRQQLTPRAARLQRRQQQQQEQQQQQHGRNGRAAAVAAAGIASAVLRPVENISTGGSAGAGAACGSVQKEQQQAAMTVAAVPVKVRPISQDEFSGLPGWCRGLLTVELLNDALQELAELAAARAGKRSLVPFEGFTAADLELLGHSSSKSKTIVSCLHKLGRATLQRSAAGSNVYKLVGAASGSSGSSSIMAQ